MLQFPINTINSKLEPEKVEGVGPSNLTTLNRAKVRLSQGWRQVDYQMKV